MKWPNPYPKTFGYHGEPHDAVMTNELKLSGAKACLVAIRPWAAEGNSMQRDTVRKM